MLGAPHRWLQAGAALAVDSLDPSLVTVSHLVNRATELRPEHFLMREKYEVTTERASVTSRRRAPRSHSRTQSDTVQTLEVCPCPLHKA